MSTIVTRAGKGSALTFVEADANFTNLNTDKMESFTLAGDTGTSQSIGPSNTLTIAGGTNLNSVASATDTVTLNLDTTVTGLTSLTSTTLITETIQSAGNSPITIAPDGTGDVHLNADSVRIGDNNSDATISTRGTGDLILTTNEGSGVEGIVRIYDGANGNITLTPNGSGRVVIDGISHPIADGTANQVLQTNGSGVLSFATVGVAVGSVTGLGSGVATFLATPSSANLISAITDETGTGALLFANSPTLVTPVLGAASAVSVNFQHTANGDRLTVSGSGAGSNNRNMTLKSATLGADRTVTIPDQSFTVGFRNIPAVGTKTGSYTLAVEDVGEYVQVGSGGSITIPNATFAEGDVVVIANNHSAAITITCTITDAYIAGTDTDKATVSLATRGLCNILFLSGTRCIISGNVS
jgi:hypothetical protein